MSTLLLYTSPARGHLYPMMDVAVAMQAAGHRVVVQTLAAERDHVRAAGVEHRPIDPRVESIPLEDFRAGGLGKLTAAPACWATRAPSEVDDLRRTIDEVEADLLLVDVNSWGASATAEASGLPWASFLPYCLPVPSRDAPAFGPGFRPPRTALGRLRDGAVSGILERSYRPHLARLSALRADLGLGPLTSATELFTRPPLLLYRTAEPFEYPRSDWPTNVRPLGPGLWAPPGEAPGWLAALPRPRVLVSVSTELQEDGAIIETALEGLAGRPGSVVVTTAALDPATFRAPNERVRITRFLSHAEVLPHVDVVVTHGGMGTTQRALAAGVPLCVVPWGRDQKESARRVEVADAGVMLAPRRLTPARLSGAVDAALARREGAERIARAFAAAGGAPRAVELLGSLAGAGSPTA